MDHCDRRYYATVLDLLALYKFNAMKLIHILRQSALHFDFSLIYEIIVVG